MLNYDSLKIAFNFINNNPQINVHDWLLGIPQLSEDEKKVIMAFYSPKPVIEKWGLPKLLCGKQGIDRLTTIIGAWRSDEYHGFIVHLIISYIINGNKASYISDINDINNIGNCAITGATIFGASIWKINFEKDPQEQLDKTRLAIGNPSESTTILSREGIQLIGELYNLLSAIEINFNYRI